MFEATNRHYKDFIETVVWKDILGYVMESIELNRDLLERTSGQECSESDEMLRGRCAGLRGLVNYVTVRATKEDEELA